jgi:cobalt-precorrin-5B (C1)-methyltransferase
MGAASKLKTGFTTGAAAAAAAKGALVFLLEGKAPEKVRIAFLGGGVKDISLHTCRADPQGGAVCSVIKDAGDDPDVTHKAEIGAWVRLAEAEASNEVVITGGAGVGRVTKPGLDLAPGQPAINPGPRRMIRNEVQAVLRKHGVCRTVAVEVFVSGGEQLARKTLNARLGVVGGISILGTTGLVRPLSHEAYIATIRSALSVARAAGLDQVALSTGRRSERFAQALQPKQPVEGFIQIGDYFQESMQMAASFGFERIVLAVLFAKAVKMAQGIGHTHAAKSPLILARLAQWTLEATGDQALAGRIAAANTARHAFELLQDVRPAVLKAVGRRVLDCGARFAVTQINVAAVIFDYQGVAVYEGYRPAHSCPGKDTSA